MTAQEEFKTYKEDFDKKQLKRARAQALILGSATVLTVLGMLYGLINNIEAGTQRDLALKNEQDAIALKNELGKQKGIVTTLEQQLADIKTQLVECKSGK
jgi:hypothetical protein